MYPIYLYTITYLTSAKGFAEDKGNKGRESIMNVSTTQKNLAALQAYAKKDDKKEQKDKTSAAGTKPTESANAAYGIAKKNGTYGSTVGEPKLSDKASKYYTSLKKKYGQYDFILVGKDEKENVKKNTAKYANGIKTVVLIDEETIEKMSKDEKYRQKYEGILSGAEAQIEQLKSELEKSGAQAKGFGIEVGDNGTAKYFAVLKKSSADQKARIEKNAEKKKAEKAADKKAAAKADKADGSSFSVSDDDEEEIVFKADSIEELLQKINDHILDEKSDNAVTEAEKMIGQHIDIKG